MATKSSSSSSSKSSSSSGKSLKAGNGKVVNVKAGQLTASQSNLLASKGYKVQTSLSGGTYDAQTGEQVSDATSAAPAKKTPAVVPEPAKITPTEQPIVESPAIPEPTKNVIKTDALQARIDARNKAGLNAPTNPYTQAPEQVGVTPSEGVKAETAPPVVVEPTPAPVTPPAETKAPAEPVKTPEQVKAEADAAKANAETQKIDADKNLQQVKSKEVDPMNEDEAFAVLMAGGDLTKNMKNAGIKERFRLFKQYSSMSAKEIGDKNVLGEISQGVLDKIAKYEPEKFQEVIKYTENGLKIDSINKTSQRLYQAATKNKIVKELSALEKVDAELNAIINGDKPSIRGMREEFLLNNKKIKEKKVELANIDADISEIEDAIEYQYDDMRGQFPTVPKGIMMGMVAAQTKELNRTLNTKIRERNMVYAEYQAEKEEANAAMQFEMQVVAEERANRQEQITYLQTKFNTLKSDEMWEKEKKYQTEAATIAYNRGDIQAAKQHERNLETLRIGQEFSAKESKLQRDQAMEIVKIQMKNSGIETDIIENADGTYTRTTYDKNTGRSTNEIINPPAIGTEPVEAKDGTKVTYQTDANGNLTVDFGPVGVAHNPKRPECGQWFNDKTGLGVGDDYESKIRATGASKTKQPQVGDAFVTPNGGITLANGKKTGHIGIVKTVFPDGSIEVVESNYQKVNGIGIVSTRIIKPTDQYRKDMSFGQTKFSKSALGSNKDVNGPEITTALANLSIKGAAKWWTGELQKGFEGIIKNYGAGSPQISGYLNNVIAKDKGEAWGIMRNAITGMEEIKSNIDKFSKEYPGEVFGVTGNIQANIDKIQSQLGTSVISPSTRAKLQLQSQILLQLQAYRKSVTGAAASELESKEYKELFPKANDSVSMTSTKINTLLDEFKRIEQQTQRDYLGGDEQYNYVIKGQKPGTAPKEVSIASVVGDTKYSLSNESQKNFWNTTFGKDINSFSDFMFGPN